MASTINTLAGALYKVFSVSPNDTRKELVKLILTTEPWKIFLMDPLLFSRLINCHQLSLILHFFAVAFYGIGRFLSPVHSFESLWIGAQIVLYAFGIIFPIIKA